MPFTLIIGIILIISIAILIFGFIKKIRILKYFGIAASVIAVLLISYLIVALTFSNM